MTADSGIDEVDLRVLTLLRELSELDASKGKSPATARQPQLKAALENATALEQLGGGSLGLDKVRAIRKALADQLGSVDW